MKDKAYDFLFIVRYMNPLTTDVYTSVMEKRGLQPEIVPLPHDAEGFWLGNKNAKNVVVYFHGTSSHDQHRASPV